MKISSSVVFFNSYFGIDIYDNINMNFNIPGSMRRTLKVRAVAVEMTAAVTHAPVKEGTQPLYYAMNV